MGCVINCHRNASAQGVGSRGEGEAEGDRGEGWEDQAVSLESTVL